MKKIIIPIILFFILSVFSFGLPSFYAYGENDYANFNFIQGANAPALIGGAGINRTVCQPFVIGQDGYIETFVLDGSSTGLLKYCISDDLVHPKSTSCSGGTGGFTAFSIPDTVNNYLEKRYWEKGEKAYICLQEDIIGVHTLASQSTNTYSFEDDELIYSVTTPSFLSSQQQLKTTDNSFKQYYSDEDVLGFHENFQTDNRRAKNFQYCMRRSEGSPSNCYVVSGQNSQPLLRGSDSTIDMIGEIFTWTQADTNTVSIGGYMQWGSGTIGDEQFIMALFHIDKETGVESLIDVSAIFSYNNLTQGNFTLFITPALINSTLIQGEDYYLGVSCFLNCAGGSDSLIVAYSSYKTTNDYYEWGYQDSNGYLAEYSWLGSAEFINYTNEDFLFYIEAGTKIWFSDETLKDIEGILNCPIENCLFYDDFKYENNFDISLRDYGDWTDSAVIFEEHLYLNSSYTVEGLPIISHDFTILDYDYDKIISITEFDIDFEVTPSTLEDDYIVYRQSLACNLTPSSTWNTYFIRDDAWSLSENRTVINVYTWVGGTPILLGTFTIDNGQYFVVKNEFDLNNQKVELDILRQEDIEEGFIPEQTFKYEMDIPCTHPTGFILGRRDYQNAVNIDFISIDKLFFYGENLPTDDSGLDFLYDNATTQEDAIVEDEVGELLHNTAFTLGFKTTATLLLFWFLLVGIFIYAMLKSDLSSSAKGIGTVFIVVTGIIIGWYLKFVPTIVLIFLVFIVAMLGAIIIQRMIKGDA